VLALLAVVGLLDVEETLLLVEVFKLVEVELAFHLPKSQCQK